MIVSEDLLLSYGAKYQDYSYKDVIFKELSMPRFYFQIVTGSVELNNYMADGKEFTHNIITDGQSFGESLLFINHPYPINAVALTDCTIIKLGRSEFMSLLRNNPKITMDLFVSMSERLFHKYNMLFTLSSTDAQTKIKGMLDYEKILHGKSHDNSFIVPYTRQQIANLTALRVETVIRSLRKMAEKGILKLEGRKIIY